MNATQGKFKSALTHGLLAFLTEIGMVLANAEMFGLMEHAWLAAFAAAVLTIAVTLLSLKRKAALFGGICAGGAFLLWLPMGGLSLLTDCFLGLRAVFSGLTFAFPLVGKPFLLGLVLLYMIPSWLATQREVGSSVILLILAMLLTWVWVEDIPQALPWMLPLVLACLIQLLRSGYEETPTFRVVPLALALTLLVSLVLSLGGITVQPLKELAENIRRIVYDNLFYTEPRASFSLAGLGYYPQGRGQMGGPAAPEETPVLAAMVPHKTYLKGVSRSVYTGRVWTDEKAGQRYLWNARQFDALRSSTFNLDLPALPESFDDPLLIPQPIRVQMVQGSVSTLFLPQRVRTLTPEGELTAYFNVSGEIFATENLVAGDAWSADAALFTSADWGLQALVEAASRTPDPGWKTVCDTYLQLPEHMDSRIYALAAEITAGISSPYEKAQALRRYLKNNYEYTLDAPYQDPSKDFVASFLLFDKAGYCVHFASAMTVLCRMAGLPARYCEGFQALPDETGLAVLSGLEGHAWTEVYFSGFGWVTFDATAGDETEFESVSRQERPDPDNTPQPSPSPSPTPSPAPDPSDHRAEHPESTPSPTQIPTSTPAPAEEPDSPDGEDNPAPEDREDSPFPWWTLLLLLAIARFVTVQPDVRVHWQNTEFRKWMVYTQAAHDALRRHGFVRMAAESPAAFFVRITGACNLPVEGLARMENLMFYGHAAPYPEETAAAREAYLALYRALNGPRKVLFHLQRCLPGRFFDITRS